MLAHFDQNQGPLRSSYNAYNGVQRVQRRTTAYNAYNVVQRRTTRTTSYNGIGLGIPLVPRSGAASSGRVLQAAVGCCSLYALIRHVTAPLLGKFGFDTSRHLCSGNLVSTRHGPSVRAWFGRRTWFGRRFSHLIDAAFCLAALIKRLKKIETTKTIKIN